MRANVASQAAEDAAKSLARRYGGRFRLVGISIVDGYDYDGSE